MSNQDVFTDEPKPSELSTPEELLAAIKNENGEQKYADVEQGLKALIHSQEHISTVEANYKKLAEEKQALEDKLKEASTLDEVVNRLSASQAGQVEETPTQSPPTQAVDEEALANLVSNMISQRDENEKRRANRQAVQAKLVETYGDKASEVLSAKAAEVGSTTEDLGKLAETSPQLVLNLFNGQGQPTANPSTSTINMSNVQPTPEKLKAPEKSLLVGASTQDITDFMKQVKEEVNQELGVET